MEQATLDLGDLTKAVDLDATPESLADDEIFDFITGKVVKERGNEAVRQRIARALVHEYGISVDDMARNFSIPMEAQGLRRSTKKADIAIFLPGTKHELANLHRVVICKPQPKPSKTITKIRTHKQAEEDLAELEMLLLGTDATPEVEFGMWTNGLDFFFLHKVNGRFGAIFEPRADWPAAAESDGGRAVGSAARLRLGEHGMVQTAFKRCHNYIHGNEGMAKDTAFWQFLYVLFAKIHDERASQQTGKARRFYALPQEPFEEAGQRAIAARIHDLFTDVKRKYPNFRRSDEIRLSDAALAFLVGELSSYDLTHTDFDVKGMAYQELVGDNLRGDRGQYFTPKGAVRLMVDILDPQEDDVVLDPACGTGGFLREAAHHQLKRWKAADGTVGLPDTDEQIQRLAAYTTKNIFGADFDQNLVRTTIMGLMALTAGASGNIYFMDSLMFPHGDKPDNDEANKKIRLGTVDVLMANPPFGTDIKVEDTKTLGQYRHGVAQSWTRDRDTGLPVPGRNPVTAMAPEQLFIQRAIEWVRPGGRIGIVLPNGILSNPGPADEAIRRWILDNCWVLASIELPVETFIVDAGVNILTSLLFLKKKTDADRMNATNPAMGAKMNNYPVFMAVAEKVGFDRRGNPVHKRRPDGEQILTVHTEIQTIRRNGKDEFRTLYRKAPILDDDLPVIADEYRKFRRNHPEPGSGQE